ncbi:MAG: hypothetical protein HFI86_08185 [Bacilli bacterium]|nr:hypothetical protein [Bacilli bacterium]
MGIKQTIERLTLYQSDLYEGKIIIIPNSENVSLKMSSNIFIQTDATEYTNEFGNIKFNYGYYNYILVRKFVGCKNTQNEMYYNFDDLRDSGLDLAAFFPIMPNNQIINYYLENSNVNKSSYQKYIDYASKLNKNFYKKGV